MKIRGAIIGGAGYTGGELFRLSMAHPNLEIHQVISRSQTDKPIASIHSDLLGDTGMRFTSKVYGTPDVLFLCMGHGQSKNLLADQPALTQQPIIDLSQDFRINNDEHTFQYGLPEVYRDSIINAKQIANPGCFATAIQLGLLPLAAANKLSDAIHAHAITGSTGAGQSLRDTTHFTWRANNVSTYKVFEHQHLAEINQTLSFSNKGDIPPIHFVPVRGSFTRGIYTSMYTAYNGSSEDANKIYKDYYNNHPFVIISDENPDLKQVVNTNKCILHLQKKGDFLYIISIIDNLLKGAVGQAIQNMNLMFGLDETQGLKSKSNRF